MRAPASLVLDPALVDKVRAAGARLETVKVELAALVGSSVVGQRIFGQFLENEAEASCKSIMLEEMEGWLKGTVALATLAKLRAAVVHRLHERSLAPKEGRTIDVPFQGLLVTVRVESVDQELPPC